MSAGAVVRLLLWADAWPAVYPADATLERVPWATRPEHVATRAQGLAAHAIALLPPSGPGDAASALAALRRHTPLPLWLIGQPGRLPSDLPAGLEPVRALRDLEPRAVEAALAADAANAPAQAATGRRPPAPADPVVTVFGPCGGAGVSTVATALGRVLAAWRLPTVVVDLNLHAPTQAVLLGAFAAAQAPPALETYLRDTATTPVGVVGAPGLCLVPGLDALENLDDVSVGKVVALLERLRGSVRVVDTAPVVTDPAVYSALRSATHTILVSDDRVASRLQLKRYRRLFLQLGLGWRNAMLVINHPRPSSTGPSTVQIEEEIGLRPLTALPYRSAVAAHGPGRGDAVWRAGIERLAATVVGRPPPPAGGARWRGPVRDGR